MSPRPLLLVPLAVACVLGPLAGSAPGADDEVARARRQFVEAMRSARLERRAAPAAQVVDLVIQVARRLRSEEALDLLRDVAVETPHPYQRLSAVRWLAGLEPRTPEPARRTALRLADAAREMSLDIRPTSFVTPNWSVQEAALANAGMAESLRDWFASRMDERLDEPPAWFREIAPHKRAVARLALAGAVVERLPSWGRRTARRRMTADKLPEVRALWIQALALYGETRAVPHILRQSLSKHAVLREAAVRALDLLAPDDPATRARFLQGFGSESAVELALAAREAGRQQSDATAGRLWETLESPYWEARAQAVESLGLVRTRRSVEVLVKALPGMSLDMRARCMRSLRRLTGADLAEVEDWQAWWRRDINFKPAPEEPAAFTERDVRGRREALPPEGRRFAVFCFLPTARSPSAAVSAGLAKLFFDLASGVDEEGAVAIRAGGWWSIKGEKATRLSDPSTRVPSISSRSLYRSGSRPPKYDWPPQGPVIPYLDPVGPVLEVARRKVPSFLSSNVRAAPDAVWRELAAVLGTAETETIVLLASRDVSAEAAARFEEQLRRLRWAATGRPIRLRMAHYGDGEPKRLAGLVESLGGAWMTRRLEAPEAQPRNPAEGAPPVTSDSGWLDDRVQPAAEDWTPAGDIRRARVRYTSDREVIVEVEPAHPLGWSDVVLRVLLDLDDARATKGYGPSHDPAAKAAEAWSQAKGHGWFGADAFLALRLMSAGPGKPPHLNYWSRSTRQADEGPWGRVECGYQDGRIRLAFDPSAIGIRHLVTRSIGLRLELEGINLRRFEASIPAAPGDVALDRLPGFRPKATRVPLGGAALGPSYGQGLNGELFAMRRGDRVAYRLHADPRTSGWRPGDDLTALLSSLLEMPEGGRAGHWLDRPSAEAPAEILASSVNPEDHTFLLRFPATPGDARAVFMLRFQTTDRWPDSAAGGVRLVRAP